MTPSFRILAWLRVTAPWSIQLAPSVAQPWPLTKYFLLRSSKTRGNKTINRDREISVWFTRQYGPSGAILNDNIRRPYSDLPYRVCQISREVLQSTHSIARLRRAGLVWHTPHRSPTSKRLLTSFKPMPPWNPVFGHLDFCYKITSALPKDAHPKYLPDMIRRQLPELGLLYYLDTWPFGPRMLIVASTEGLHQITQETSLPKYPALNNSFNLLLEGWI